MWCKKNHSHLHSFNAEKQQKNNYLFLEYNTGTKAKFLYAKQCHYYNYLLCGIFEEFVHHIWKYMSNLFHISLFLANRNSFDSCGKHSLCFAMISITRHPVILTIKKTVFIWMRSERRNMHWKSGIWLDPLHVWGVITNRGVFFRILSMSV